MGKSKQKKVLSKKAAERVAIAKDVIAQIKAKRFRTVHVYLQPDTKFDRQFAAKVSEENDKKQIVAPKKCGVCAIGGLFVSALDRNDRLALRDTKIGDHSPRYAGLQKSKMVEYLGQWFDREQLDLMEAAYEQQTFSWSLDQSVVKYLNAVSFGEDIEKDDDRMIAIMRNVIKNGGKFKPPAAVRIELE